jgi:transcription elongation GreA/GreB family factor
MVGEALAVYGDRETSNPLAPRMAGLCVLARMARPGAAGGLQQRMRTSNMTELTQLAGDGRVDEFETRCLELLEQGQLGLGDLARAFEVLGSKAPAPRVGALAQMVLENSDLARDPAAALGIARTALLADSNSGALRDSVVRLYRQVHGERAGFEALLEQSGLAADRPARAALRALELCLSLAAGDALMSRTDGTVVEIAQVDSQRGLFTLRHSGRTTTLPAEELSRRYDRADPQDFRVLRELRPEKLAAMIADDPVAVVVGLIRSHGDWIDQDTLKAELVPDHIDEGAWSKWWTRARTALKRSRNVVLEGRTPLILRYTAAASSLEDETWSALLAQPEPMQWLDTLGGYFREKKSMQQAPDAVFMDRVSAHVLAEFRAARPRRQREALEAALVLFLIEQQSGAAGARPGREAATELLREAHDPSELIANLTSETLWGAALDLLAATCPEDAAARTVELMPQAPAGLLDRIVDVAGKHGLTAMVQAHVDTALADPLDNSEILYWLWAGPKAPAGLRVPSDSELLSIYVPTLAALGRSLQAPETVLKRFRQRAKAALSRKDFVKYRACLKDIDAARAITLRQQLLRLEGLGENTPARLLDLLRDAHPTLWQTPIVRKQPWEDADVLWATTEGLSRRTQERDELVNVAMRDNARRIGEAAALGDLSENSEYKFALEERDLLRARLAQMNTELSMARTLSASDVPTDEVGIGSRVTLRRLSDGHVRTLSFLGPFEANPDQAVFNYQAPVSQRLMGKRVGDRVLLSLEGSEAEYEISQLANALGSP